MEGSERLLCGMPGKTGRPERAQLLSKTPHKALGKQQAVQVHAVTDHGSLAGACPAELACGALGEKGWGFWHDAQGTKVHRCRDACTAHQVLYRFFSCII